MISYAQNHEDVLLARALLDTETGFYIDVGAYDPTSDSVTRHFYDLGWHGINVEPQSAYAAKLRDARPRDVTLEVALSDHSGTSVLYELSIGDGVATINEPQARRLGGRYDVTRETQVPVLTLADVCAQHCSPGTAISFLKIDVEGHEREVLAGADWTRYRPRIVVVEATEPMTTTPSHQSWDPILLDAGYLFVQFDGLNRWYARRDESSVIEQLRIPVNALDVYAPYAWVANVRRLQAEVDALTARLAEATAEPVRKETLIRSLENLQERYERLSAALEEERSLRASDAEKIAELATRITGLTRPPVG